MTKDEAQFLKQATEYFGNQEIDVRDDYSGRGMMGRTTYGIVVSSWSMLMSDVIAYIKECGQDNPNFIKDIPDFNTFSVDSVARDIILY